VLGDKEFSSVWGDAGIICPWRVYMTFGNKEVLAEQFESMKKWVSYIESHTKEENLWIGGFHFGDWCALDLGYETTDSLSDRGFIASVFYANAVETVAKAGKILGIDVSYYEEKYPLIIKAIQDKYPENAYKSQTEHALSLYYNVAIDRALVAKNLADKVINNGTRLDTGFVGTPYLLHALAENGYADVAYSLLLQTKFPSWLFSVKQGATTIWEHWDGIKEDGSVWSAGMNSYNHYAYGAVGDWMYGVMAGINTKEDAPGFAKIFFAPVPDERIDWFKAEINTARGKVSSRWWHENGRVHYEIETPVDSTALIDGKMYELSAGKHIFNS
jgi:alpha-L-rhamnosidase